jgi:hypothetical protein
MFCDIKAVSLSFENKVILAYLKDLVFICEHTNTYILYLFHLKNNCCRKEIIKMLMSNSVTR